MLTKREKTLIVTLITVIVVAFLAVFWILVIQGKKENRICQTAECIRSASTILDSLDYSKDPCENFYMFVCGNYLNSNFIPEDEDEINSLLEIKKSVSHKLRTVLEQPVSENDETPFMFLKSQYRTCLNETEDNTSTLKELLKQMGGWPVVEGDKWNSTNFDWRIWVHSFRRAGLYSEMFLAINVKSYADNFTKVVLELDKPIIPYGDFLVNGWKHDVTRAMYDLMVDISVLLGADSATAEAEMEQTMSFLVNLVKITVSIEKIHNPVPVMNIMSINDLELIYPLANWSSYINNQLMGLYLVNTSSTLNVVHPKYLKELDALIIHNKERTIANFMLWTVILKEISYFNGPLRNRLNEFLEIVFGHNIQNIPQWRKCIDDITMRLPLATGALFASHFFKKEDKYDAQVLVDNILQELKEEIHSLEWMENHSKQRAIKKINAMKTFVGYSDELLDFKKLSRFHAELGNPPENYLLLNLKITNFTVKARYRLLTQEIYTDNWMDLFHPTDVFTSYERRSNSLYLPAGILHEIFYSLKKPKFTNYGGIGLVIAHEILHGFDDKGRLYNRNGDFENWWGDETKNAFMENALCVAEQYDNITIPENGIKIDGDKSQDENIADIGSVKLAYLAYKKWLSQHKQEIALPGFSSYTNLQLFWISSASSRCSKMKPERITQNLISEGFVPQLYRINVPFANSEYFAEDFKCPIGTNMNPFIKCKVW